MKSKTVIIIAGPTAVGKTSLAIEIARYFGTDIISADSRQCYHELNIGVAKPSLQQLQQAKHYFINTHFLQEKMNAALYEKYALNAVGEIFLHNDVAVMVGGTGLYIKAFCEGLDEMPPVSSAIRKEIIEKYQQYGINWLQDQLRIHDPVYFMQGEILNPQRLMRALEVKLDTGKSIHAFQHHKKVTRDFKIIKIGLDIPKEQLHHHIHGRVDEMINQGLVSEVESLLPNKLLPALRTVGYTELFRYLESDISLDDAIALIKKNTRHYAKRQLTWFRKDESFIWVSPLDKDKIIDLYQDAY